MIYLASSWKNQYIGGVSDCLDQWAIPHYDFRSDGGFHWSEVDPDYQEKELTFLQYEHMLEHEAANRGFDRDWLHMLESNACILILPCGRSAHLEAGWFIGKGLPVAIYFREKPVVPELMYKMADILTDDIDDLMRWAVTSR